MARTAMLATVVFLAALPAVGQERVPAAGELIARAKLEAEQVPLNVRVRVPLEAKVVTGAPYTADVTTESIEVLADGNRIVHRTAGRVYRDGQGRVRREEESEPGRPGTVTIMDPVVGVSYTLDPEARVAWKMPAVAGQLAMKGGFVRIAPSPADPADVERKRVIEKMIAEGVATAEAGQTVMLRKTPARVAEGPSDWEEKVEKLPARDIEGVSAEGTRTTRTIPAGAIGNERPIVMVTEEWRSPDLQVLVATSTSDPRTGESSYRLMNIVRGEPGPSAFEVPAGYTVQESKMRQELMLKREPR